MKVIAIQGSPHTGNTFERVERFGEILQSLGDIEFEHVALKDINLESCRGCFLCFERGEEACPLKDDKAALASKIDEADGVVFATPVYSMHISYLLKGFVDRFAHTFHRPRYFGKFAVGMAVTGGMGLKEALDYIRMFAGSWGFEYIGDLRYIDPPKNSSLPRLMEEKNRTDEIACKLHHAVTVKPPRNLTKNDYLHFLAMREVYSRLEHFSPVDFSYWKENGWLDPETRYFTSHIKEHAMKSLLPRLMAKMLGRSVDKGITRWRESGGY